MHNLGHTLAVISVQHMVYSDTKYILDSLYCLYVLETTLMFPKTSLLGAVCYVALPRGRHQMLAVCLGQAIKSGGERLVAGQSWDLFY